jgi:hypothetical protein
MALVLPPDARHHMRYSMSPSDVADIHKHLVNALTSLTLLDGLSTQRVSGPPSWRHVEGAMQLLQESSAKLPVPPWPVDPFRRHLPVVIDGIGISTSHHAILVSHCQLVLANLNVWVGKVGNTHSWMPAAKCNWAKSGDWPDGLSRDVAWDHVVKSRTLDTYCQMLGMQTGDITSDENGIGDCNCGRGWRQLTLPITLLDPALTIELQDALADPIRRRVPGIPLPRLKISSNESINLALALKTKNPIWGPKKIVDQVRKTYPSADAKAIRNALEAKRKSERRKERNPNRTRTRTR